MTATAERLVQEIKLLPAPDLREVWEQVGKLVAKRDAPPIVPAPERSPEEFEATLNALAGCSRGRGLLKVLLDERARERQREDAQLEAYRENRRRG